MRRLANPRTIAVIGLLTLSAWFCLGPSGLQAKNAPKVDKDAKAAFESRCAGCHGPDGAGTPLGKSLQAADLRSGDIQKKPDSELIHAVSNGKGNMPPFSTKLSAGEIQALIGYVRTLGATKANTTK
jgi:mono/diheme cytochrome c family protein